MKKAIVGKKLGMTQLFDQNGNVVPVTVIEAGPCAVVQKKTAENDGYEALQVGFGDMKASKVTKPLKGHFAKGDVAPKKVLRELRLEDTSAHSVGDIIKADVFAEGEAVDVTGTSKGKGYAGTIKRWNFGRLKESHGTGPVHRHGGSLGACSSPSRVFKGKKMAGHLGNERVTVQNLKVVAIDADKGLVMVKGGVPGSENSWVRITDALKKTSTVELPMPAGLKKVDEPVAVKAEETAENA